jgi:protein required for attachment to host cells
MTMTRGCWIVVADARGAMIVENAGTDEKPDLRLINRIETPKLTDDPMPPRGADAHAILRAAQEASDRARLAETAMVAMLVTRLTFAARQARITQLALAAPQHMLDAVRVRLDADMRARIVVAVPRALGDHALEDIVAVMNSAMQRVA